MKNNAIETIENLQKSNNLLAETNRNLFLTLNRTIEKNNHLEIYIKSIYKRLSDRQPRTVNQELHYLQLHRILTL